MQIDSLPQAGPHRPTRLLVEGSLTRRAELLVLLAAPPPAGHLIYFPGDIQTWADDMTTSDYAEYSFESMISILAEKYPTFNIWLMPPSRFIDKSSEYDDYLRPGQAIQHTMAALHAAQTLLADKGQCSVDDKLPITICAFSKGSPITHTSLQHLIDHEGSLVLNQILAEAAVCASPSSLEFLPDWEDPAMTATLPSYEITQRIARARAPVRQLLSQHATVVSWLDRVVAMHWLDAHRYPTHPNTIADFIAYCKQRVTPLELLLHVTPRQVRDTRRLHIRAEYERFVHLIRSKDCPLLRVRTAEYFNDKKPSLAMHFKVLLHFGTRPDDMPTSDPHPLNPSSNTS